MTSYNAPQEQQYLADQNRLLQRVAVLERRVGRFVAGALAVTSTTHPSNAAVPMRIYETDTGLEAYWNGTKWVYPPQVVDSESLTGSASFVTLTVPTGPGYNFLQLEWRAHLTSGGPTDLLMQVDGNTGSSYVWAKMEAVSAAQSNFHAGAAATTTKIGAVGGTTAGYFASGSLSIAGWATATGYMSTSGTSTLFDSNTSDYVGTYGDLFAVNGPHSSIKIYPASGSFAAGSQFLLLGLG